MNRREDCSTVSEALDSIATFSELRGFVNNVKNNPEGCKQLSDRDKDRITEMWLRFKQEAKH